MQLLPSDIEIVSALILGGGILILAKSASIFIDASQRISKLLMVTQLFVGLIISSIATSFPEFSISFIAAIQSEADISLGNIYGTVMANIGLGLGLAILISSLKTDRDYIVNCIFMIFVGLSGLVVAFDGDITITDGLFLLTFFIIYLFILLKIRYKEKKYLAEKSREIHYKDLLKELSLLGIGLIGIIIGARIIIWSAVNIASSFGISKLSIGVTIIAIGSSIPELSTTAMAAYKKHYGLSLGIIIGSNIIDILFIIGFSSLFINIAVSNTIIFLDIPFFILTSIILLIFMVTDSKLSKTEGIALLSLYAVYLILHFVLV